MEKIKNDNKNRGREIMVRMRSLYRERLYLLKEYNDEPSPHSPLFQENKGSSLSQITRMNDYTFKRDLNLKKIELLTSYINNFTIKTLLFSLRQRQIIEIYLNALSYKEMIDELNETYYISTSTYKREIKQIYMLLCDCININDIPTIEELNKIFYNSIQEDIE